MTTSVNHYEITTLDQSVHLLVWNSPEGLAEVMNGTVPKTVVTDRGVVTDVVMPSYNVKYPYVVIADSTVNSIHIGINRANIRNKVVQYVDPVTQENIEATEIQLRMTQCWDRMRELIGEDLFESITLTDVLDLIVSMQMHNAKKADKLSKIYSEYKRYKNYASWNSVTFPATVNIGEHIKIANSTVIDGSNASKYVRFVGAVVGSPNTVGLDNTPKINVDLIIGGLAGCYAYDRIKLMIDTFNEWIDANREVSNLLNLQKLSHDNKNSVASNMRFMKYTIANGSEYIPWMIENQDEFFNNRAQFSVQYSSKERGLEAEAFDRSVIVGSLNALKYSISNRNVTNKAIVDAISRVIYSGKKLRTVSSKYKAGDDCLKTAIIAITALQNTMLESGLLPEKE